jgi:phosphoenolpyruvate synthase/pyruvate phosphate dikinase
MYAAVYIPKHPELFVKRDRELMIKLRKNIDVYADKATGIIIRSLKHIFSNKKASLYYITFEDLLSNKVTKRKDNIYLVDGEIVNINNYKKLKTKYNFTLQKNIIAKKKELKGTVAYKGKAKGRVIILVRRADINKVKKGDILVTYMTIPDYIPAMKMAAAYVTDEGGITCHAAVIAREFKKPCIIGTKFASQIFKNGDLVEVDAIKGLIKKL